MKKKFKSILLFSSILGVGAITAGAVALTSCGSNVDKPIDNTTSSKPITPNIPNDNLDSGNSTQKPSTPITPNPPGSDSGISGGNNQDSSQEQTPIVLPTLDERQRAIIKNSPTLSWLYDTTGGARFILNNQNITTQDNINNDVNDKNVNDLMTLCGLKQNIDPFKDNAYFPNALTFSQAVNKAGNSTNVNITVDPSLSDSISFYLFNNYAINPLDGESWIKLGDSKNIELLNNASLYFAIKFNENIIDDYDYAVPQLFAENNNNTISNQYTFQNLSSVGQDVNSKANSREQTSDISQSDFNKNVFFYKLKKTSTERLADDSVDQTSNKVELVLKKKEDQQNNVSSGWKTINTLVEGTIDPRASEDGINVIDKVTVNDVVNAKTYTVLDKDANKILGSTQEKYFQVNDKTMPFATTYSDPSQLPNKRKVNLYVLYTNGNNIDLNQLVVKAGCKLLLINNNPNKTSKVICSSSFLQYGKGNENGLQFDLGSSFGWYGKFDFTVLTKWNSIISSNIKDFIFKHKDEVNYTLPTTSKLLVSFEPNNKFKDL